MRIKPGWTVTEAIEALSPEQRLALDAVKTAREEEDARVAAALHVTRESVKRALDAGVPAAVLASLLDLTRTRVYQMRDEAQTYLQEMSA